MQASCAQVNQRPPWLQRTLLCAIAFACTIGSATHPQEPSKDAHESFKEHPIAVGWVQAAGEIRIYARKADLGKLYDGSCISGVLTRMREMPKNLANHHVAVYGRLVDAKEFYEQATRGITTGVENYCGSDKIAIITRIVETPPPVAARGEGSKPPFVTSGSPRIKYVAQPA